MKTLTRHLQQVKAEKGGLVVPYIMAGDGGLDTLAAKLQLLEKGGVSAIEVGVPFSDPVADGPVIQAAGLRALEQEVSLSEIITTLRNTTVTVPLVIMTYLNPLFHYGLEQLVRDLAETPVKGLIIPDLPYEHRDLLLPLLADTDIALVPLLSLTTPRARMQELVAAGEGFIYAVAVNGVTGMGREYQADLDEHLAYLTEISPIPVLAGFGISEQEHVIRFKQCCDGVVIGSKIVQMLADHQERELQEFLTAIV